MASPVPAKSQPQPLYSFSLTGWKLTKNHTNNHHRGRRGGADSSSSSQQLPPHDTARRRSPLLHSAHRQSPMRDSVSSSSSDHHQTVKADKQQQQQREVFDHDESRSKIYIRLKPPSKSKKAYGGQVQVQVQDEGNPDMEGTEVEESMGKTWNLRPRKPIRKQINLSVKSSSPENKVQSPSSTVLKRSEMRSAPQAAAAVAVQKEKKRKFSISLSRDEIEEDIYAMIGSKPNRRPKKRSKIVQRQLDSLFPGLWLSTITPDAYKVSEIPMKG